MILLDPVSFVMMIEQVLLYLRGKHFKDRYLVHVK